MKNITNILIYSVIATNYGVVFNQTVDLFLANLYRYIFFFQRNKSLFEIQTLNCMSGQHFIFIKKVNYSTKKIVKALKHFCNKILLMSVRI